MHINQLGEIYFTSSIPSLLITSRSLLTSTKIVVFGCDFVLFYSVFELG